MSTDTLTKNNNATAPSALASIKAEVVDRTVDQIRGFVQSGKLHLPADFSAENALKSAWLDLLDVKDKNERSALTVCKPSSVAVALMSMAVQGLDPGKRQCYFIVYGDRLVCQRSYFGDEALAKRVHPGANVYAQVVYDQDEFEYEIDRGQPRVVRHRQSLANVDQAKIVGAYAIVEAADGSLLSGVVMSIQQIKQSWSMSKTYKPDGGNSPHHKFAAEMCLRTVIRKACKPVINSSNDALLMDHVRAMDALAAKAEADADAGDLELGYDLEPLPAPEADLETGEVVQAEEAPF